MTKCIATKHMMDQQSSLNLLRQLIAIPRSSRKEKEAADFLQHFIEGQGLKPQRVGNNLYIVDTEWRTDRPTLLLNAHIDTVRPTDAWTRNPYEPTLEGDRLYGLGSNDCGGGLVALLSVFVSEMSKPNATRACNLVFAASAEEEVSGSNGFELLLQSLPHIDAAIVGEPTSLQPAVAERGLMVIDCLSRGQSGHAARNEGINAIEKAADDILRLRNHSFERISPLLGAVKTTVTIINAGTQHNVIPAECHWTIDVRINELYSHEEVLAEMQSLLQSQLTPRSMRLRSSAIPLHHPLVARCIALGLQPFGSPTLSDQALMPFPSIKLGPGDSSRSHTPDEYIYLADIARAIDLYTNILNGLTL